MGEGVRLATNLVVPSPVSPILGPGKFFTEVWNGRVEVGPASTLKGSSVVERKIEQAAEPISKGCGQDMELDLLPVEEASIHRQYESIRKLGGMGSSDGDYKFALHEIKISIQTRNVERLLALYNEAKVSVKIGKGIAKNTKMQWYTLATLVDSALTADENEMLNYPAKSALLEILKEERGAITGGRGGKHHLQQSILMEMGVGYGAWHLPVVGESVVNGYSVSGIRRSRYNDDVKTIVGLWLDAKVCESLRELESKAVKLNHASAKYSRLARDNRQMSNAETNDWAKVQDELREVLNILGKNPVKTVGKTNSVLDPDGDAYKKYFSEVVKGNRKVTKRSEGTRLITGWEKMKNFFSASGDFMEVLSLGSTEKQSCGELMRIYLGCDPSDGEDSFHSMGFFPGMWSMSGCFSESGTQVEAIKHESPQIQHMLGRWLLRGYGVVGETLQEHGNGDLIATTPSPSGAAVGVVRKGDLVGLSVRLQTLFPGQPEWVTETPTRGCARLLLRCANLKRDSLGDLEGSLQCLLKASRETQEFDLGFFGDTKNEWTSKWKSSSGFAKEFRRVFYGIKGEKERPWSLDGVKVGHADLGTKQTELSRYFSELLDAGFDGDSVSMLSAIKIALGGVKNLGVSRDHLLAINLIEESISQGMMFNRKFREAIGNLAVENPHIFLFKDRRAWKNISSGIWGLGHTERGSGWANFMRRNAAWGNKKRCVVALLRGLSVDRKKDIKALRDEYLVNNDGRLRMRRFYSKFRSDHSTTVFTQDALKAEYMNARTSMEEAYSIVHDNREERIDWIKEQMAFFRCCENTEEAGMIADIIDARIRNPDGTRRREIDVAEMRGYIEIGKLLLPEQVQVKNTSGKLYREACNAIDQVAVEGGMLPSSTTAQLRGIKLTNMHRSLGDMGLTDSGKVRCKKFMRDRYFVENIALKREYIERSLRTNIDWSSVLAEEQECRTFNPSGSESCRVREADITDWLETGWNVRAGVKEIRKAKLYIEYRPEGFPVRAEKWVECPVRLPVSVTRELSEKMGMPNAKHSSFFAHIEKQCLIKDFVVQLAASQKTFPTISESLDIEQKAFFASSHDEQKRYFTEVNRALTGGLPVTKESLYVFLLALQQCPQWLPTPPGGKKLSEIPSHPYRVLSCVNQSLIRDFHSEGYSFPMLGAVNGSSLLRFLNTDEEFAKCSSNQWHEEVSSEAGKVAKNLLNAVLVAEDYSGNAGDSASFGIN